VVIAFVTDVFVPSYLTNLYNVLFVEGRVFLLDLFPTIAYVLPSSNLEKNALKCAKSKKLLPQLPHQQNQQAKQLLKVLRNLNSQKYLQKKTNLPYPLHLQKDIKPPVVLLLLYIRPLQKRTPKNQNPQNLLLRSLPPDRHRVQNLPQNRVRSPDPVHDLVHDPQDLTIPNVLGFTATGLSNLVTALSVADQVTLPKTVLSLEPFLTTSACTTPWVILQPSTRVILPQDSLVRIPLRCRTIDTGGGRPLPAAHVYPGDTVEAAAGVEAETGHVAVVMRRELLEEILQKETKKKKKVKKVMVK